ncbi:hypothetical protein FOA52_013980 [Chlamydomonas sp. UWO 241]|nr:hypothetical protein FOA52_013980 [Chlamydomonas sp. UWO 241]
MLSYLGNPGLRVAKCDLKPTPSGSAARKQVQLCLDLGQRAFGPSRCTGCGMLYTKGQPDDERTHRDFHQAVSLGFKFQGWAHERVVLDEGARGRLLMVLGTDSAAQVKKAAEVCAHVEQALGLASGWLLPTFGSSSSLPASRGAAAAAPAAPGGGGTEVVFLYVTPSKRVTAVLVVERLSRAQQRVSAAPPAGGSSVRGISCSAAAAVAAAAGAGASNSGAAEGAATGHTQEPRCGAALAGRDLSTVEEVVCDGRGQPGSNGGLPPTSTGRPEAEAGNEPARASGGVAPQSRGGQQPVGGGSGSAAGDRGGSASASGSGGPFPLEPPVAGVRGVWVSQEVRRSGLATRMVSTARRTLVHGYVVPRQRLAFAAQQSDAGRAWAEAYCGGAGSVVCYY